MSAFGSNYQKNDLTDDIQHFFSEGGTLNEMFDVLNYVFEYGQNPFDKLKEENQELKKQLEDKNYFINKLQAIKDKLDKWDYENTMAKQEFIKYLKNKSEIVMRDAGYHQKICLEILSKYKEIVGDTNE